MVRFGEIFVEDATDDDDTPSSSYDIVYEHGTASDDTHTNNNDDDDDSNNAHWVSSALTLFSPRSKTNDEHYDDDDKYDHDENKNMFGLRRRRRRKRPHPDDDDDDDDVDDDNNHHYHLAQQWNNNNNSLQSYHQPDYFYKKHHHHHHPILHGWKKVLFIILTSWFIHHWYDFYSSLPPLSSSSYPRHVWNTWSSLRSTACRLLIHDVMSTMEDVSYFWTEGMVVTTRRRKNEEGLCRLAVPTRLPPPSSIPSSSSLSLLSPTEQWLRHGIIGQNTALSTISSALDGWHTSSSSSSSQRKGGGGGGSPMGFILAGPQGVGKSETAVLVSRWLFSNCTTSREEEEGIMDGVLFLHGHDFSSSSRDDSKQQQHHHEDGSTDAATEFTKRVVDHIHQRNNHGAIVILTNIELIPPSLLNNLSHLFRSPHHTLSYTNEYNEEISVQCDDGVLFLFLTEVGSREIVNLAGRYGGRENVPLRVLEGGVRRELEGYFGGAGGGGGVFQLGKVVDAVVPFLPLTIIELKEILHRKINNLSKQHASIHWKRLYITNTAILHLVSSDYVDYITIASTTSPIPMSKHGAHILDNGRSIQILKSLVKRHFMTGNDGNGRRVEQVAVFDYDKVNRVAVLSWCDDEREGEHDVEKRGEFVFDGSWRDGGCEETWRGFLHHE